MEFRSKKIAVTGGIGSGKSLVLALLKEKGYPVFSCDEIYQEITKEAAYIEAVGKLFPSAVKNGQIDRQELGKIVFDDEKKRTQLNAIAHPLIMERLFFDMNQIESKLVFAEVPLLFESRLQEQFDATLVVLRNKDSRIQAIMDRDGISANEAISRINAQFNYDLISSIEKIKTENTYFLRNDTSLSDLNVSLTEILNKLNQS